jgi:NAD(P)H-quinone oxidoreductase subunit 5
MGFMIMQCGLVFSMRPSFTYFMGFIKPTYFYLERKGIRNRKTNTIKIKPVQAVIVLFFGILGAFLFAYFRERNWTK